MRLSPITFRIVSHLSVLVVMTASTRASEITPKGEVLARVLDSMDVERHWLAGQTIHWRTGTPDHSGHRGATHCSAFVAAACDRVGVYILRPPDHSQNLLANAQNAWLQREGARFGWRRVATPVEAQRLANLGELVVASCHNPNPRRPGHIAIVRPSPKSDHVISAEGPQVIQAGRSNYSSVSLVKGFIHHPDAWRNGEIMFFAHAPHLAVAR
jgi:hypothetical protein